jgi:hypothetical protein
MPACLGGEIPIIVSEYERNHAMSQKPITRSLVLSFVWSFSVSVASFFGLMIFGAMRQQHEGITPVAMLLVVLMVISGPVWYASLGILANRVGRSWVGLSFITSPIGPLVIFPLMLGHIKAARQATVLPSTLA